MNGWLGDPSFDAIVERDLAEGQHRNPTNRAEWFTTAYFHHPDELREEVEEVGLTFQAIFGIEGPGWLLQDKVEQPDIRERVLRVAKAVETEPTLVGDDLPDVTEASCRSVASSDAFRACATQPS